MSIGGQFGGLCGFDGVGVWETRCGSERSVVEKGDDFEREIEGGNDVWDLGLERSEEVEMGVVLGLHSRLEILHSTYAVLVVTL